MDRKVDRISPVEPVGHLKVQPIAPRQQETKRRWKDVLQDAMEERDKYEKEGKNKGREEQAKEQAHEHPLKPPVSFLFGIFGGKKSHNDEKELAQYKKFIASLSEKPKELVSAHLAPNKTGTRLDSAG